MNIPDCESIHWKEDDVHEDPEAVLLAKTTDDAYPALVDEVVEANPYDVPCVERFDEVEELEAFAPVRDDSVGQRLALVFCTPRIDVIDHNINGVVA